VSAPERTSQQLEAIESRDRDVFLRAGAGTGKTSVLVDRFCAAALDPDVGVERILAFTFTERAADQLRRRVRQRFAALAEAAEGERLERIREAEEAADRAWISTIHGFCRRVLAMHPAAAGIDPRFRVADQAESDRLAGRAFDDAIEELVEAGGAEALELAAANRRRTLLEMTRGAYDELRSQGSPSPELPEAPAADHAAALAELIEAARAAHEACAEAKPQQIPQRERIAAAAALDPRAPADAELLDALGSLKLESSAQVFDNDPCDRYREALPAARAAVAATVLGPAYEQLRELVRRFGGAYERLKATRSALDFEDLQLRARELLSANESVRERYREQFRHLMVDEFQDTNGLQLGLIEQLRGPDTRLFMVGDEFQSIYGFRHADVEVYRRQQRRFAGGEEPDGVALPLTGNFRSTPQVLATTNALGHALLAGFEPLEAAGGHDPADAPDVELLLTADDKKGWEAEDTGLPLLPDDPSSASKVAEARGLAGRLRELVDAGEDPSEIVVLLRAFTHVTTLERALADAGLDPYVVGGRGFWSQQQVEDLRCLLAVIANPLDDQPLFGALASPACAVLPDTLWLLRKAASVPRDDGRRSARHVWPLLCDLAERGEPREGDAEVAALIAGDELERVREFHSEVSGLRERGPEDGLESLVERASTALRYDAATLARDDGEARWANVRKLMRLAREFESREGPDLAAFLEYLASRASGGDREAEAATRAEGHAGVRVMTVHSAKGLEFGVVAVADLGRRPQLGWSPLRLGRAEDTADGGEAARVGVQLGRLGRAGERLHGYAELTELAADREAEEEGRLAYVAATRAERRLILSGTINTTAKESDKPRRQPIAIQLVAELLDGDCSSREVDLASPGDGLPGGRLRVRLSEPGPGAGAALLAPREAPAAGEAPEEADPPLRRPRSAPAPTGSLSYSALSGYERCGYRFYVERVLGVATAEDAAAGGPDAAGEVPPDPDARRRFGPGLAVHALLEWSSQHRWMEPDAARVAAALAEQGLPARDQDVAEALGLVRGWLGSELREELGSARTTPELPFVLSLARTPIRGSIDLLAERPGGGVLVVDYKTDRLRGREPAQVASGYRVQRELYALAAAARGTPVETAYVFLERPGDPVRHEFAESDLEAARERIEGLLGRLGDGEFEVTHHPHRALCHDCPARERLCSHVPAAQMRDEPDPPIAPVPRSERPRPEAEGSGDVGGEPQMSLLD
jgi:ATP-dependent helicase/nuclease subunit A